MDSINAHLTMVVRENTELKSSFEQLEQQLERRAPALYLTPALRSTVFNDGLPLCWDLSPHEVLIWIILETFRSLARFP